MGDERSHDWSTGSERAAAVQHVEAAVPHLRTVNRFEFARELIVQALDVLPESEWTTVYLAARDELHDEAHDIENHTPRDAGGDGPREGS